MKNEYEDLGNGLTIIYCKSKDGKDLFEVYVNTVYMSLILPYNVRWRVFNSGGNNKIGASYSLGGPIFLVNLIGTYEYGEDKNFSLIYGNFCDLRVENIYAYPKTQGHGIELTRKREKLRSSVTPLEDRLKMPAEQKNRKIISVVEYVNGHLLVCEENNLKYDLDETANTALKIFIDEQLNIPIKENIKIPFETRVRTSMNVIKYINDHVLIIEKNIIKYDVDKESFEVIKNYFSEQKREHIR